MPVPEKASNDGIYSFFENTQNHLGELKVLTGKMENACRQMLEMLDEIDKEDEAFITPVTLTK